MYGPQLTSHFHFLQWTLVLFLLAACGSSVPIQSSPSTSPTPQPSLSPRTNATTIPHSPTVNMPPTSTNCPPNGTVRPLVTAPLSLGSHQNVIYVDNEENQDTAKPTTGTLERYDIITKKHTQIIQLPNVALAYAQISQDGQWILFSTANGVHADVTLYTINAVRMDGQGLQTLYCQSSPLINVQWSLDQKQVAIYGCQTPASRAPSLCLLDVNKGQVQTTFIANGPLANGIVLYTWLDNTHLYLGNIYASRLPDSLYLLDTTKGPNQTYKDLQPIFVGSSSIGDLDSSYDLKQVFIAYVSGSMLYQPPASVALLPAHGGQAQTLFHSPKYAILQIRSVNSHDLLLVIKNLSQPGKNVDSSHNGLWLIHSDGTGLQQLTKDGPDQLSEFSHGNQYAWSNVSRDGKFYAIEQLDTQQNKYTLSFGSLTATTRSVFASTGYQLEIAGWTTL